MHTWTAVYPALGTGFHPDVSYVAAVIDLEEGLRNLSNMVDCRLEEAKIGMGVHVVSGDMTEDFSLATFKPT